MIDIPSPSTAFWFIIEVSALLTIACFISIFLPASIALTFTLPNWLMAAVANLIARIIVRDAP